MWFVGPPFSPPFFASSRRPTSPARKGRALPRPSRQWLLPMQWRRRCRHSINEPHEGAPSPPYEWHAAVGGWADRQRGWCPGPRQRSVPPLAHAARRRHVTRRARARGDGAPPSAGRHGRTGARRAYCAPRCLWRVSARGMRATWRRPARPPQSRQSSSAARVVAQATWAPARSRHGRQRALSTWNAPRRAAHGRCIKSKTSTPTGRRGPPPAPPLAMCRTRGCSATHAAPAAAAAYTPNSGVP